MLQSIVRGDYAQGAEKAHPAIGLARKALERPFDYAHAKNGMAGVTYSKPP